MHETEGDLASLQDLLDRSAAAGSHPREVITPRRRLNAADEAFLDSGMCDARIDADRRYTFALDHSDVLARAET